MEETEVPPKKSIEYPEVNWDISTRQRSNLATAAVGETASILFVLHKIHQLRKLNVVVCISTN